MGSRLTGFLKNPRVDISYILETMFQLKLKWFYRLLTVDDLHVLLQPLLQLEGVQHKILQKKVTLSIQVITKCNKRKIASVPLGQCSLYFLEVTRDNVYYQIRLTALCILKIMVPLPSLKFKVPPQWIVCWYTTATEIPYSVHELSISVEADVLNWPLHSLSPIIMN